jgi:hypothetical protein
MTAAGSPLPAESFDIGFVVGIDLTLELAITEIEIDVLMSFPCLNESIETNVRVAETYESSGEELRS